MKNKRFFVCSECGASQGKWFGRCPHCGEWNTALEEKERATTTRDQTLKRKNASSPPLPIKDITSTETKRFITGISELDRVLGGGLLPGAAVLLGGEPGIGKSTILLQIANRIATEYGNVLYISGEESPSQIKLRAERLEAISSELYVKAENQLEEMISDIRNQKPFMTVVDSIQTTTWSQLTSAPGSVAQVRDCTALLVQLAKETNTPIVLVGHVTKEGHIAGPRMMEHLVDVVLYFEGDRHHHYRLLRGVKNRFGSTHEIGLFEMSGKGLIEITNPAGIFAGRKGERPSGSAVTVTLEGNRPLLIEIQALVAPFHGYGFPRRTVTGIDGNRLAMILAILEKRLHLPLGERDVYVNVTGGITIHEPAGDLGIACAILSSYFDISLPSQYILYGELGLAGEVRPVRGAWQRISEARQLGYMQGIIPEGNAQELARQGIPLDGLQQVKNIEEVRSTHFPS